MRRIYLTAFLISVLVLVSASYYLYYKNPDFIKVKILHNVSKADVLLLDNQLKINFHIIDEDKNKLINFSNVLGIDQDWINGMSITLDQASINSIKQIFPIQADLKFKDGELDFSSSFTSNLSSSLPGQSYQISTGSAKLIFNTRGSNDFDLNIDEPDLIIKYATSSGKLYLSSTIQQLFPIMSKIARIRLTVKDKNVSGSVLLK